MEEVRFKIITMTASQALLVICVGLQHMAARYHSPKQITITQIGNIRKLWAETRQGQPSYKRHLELD